MRGTAHGTRRSGGNSPARRRRRCAPPPPHLLGLKAGKPALEVGGGGMVRLQPLVLHPPVSHELQSQVQGTAHGHGAWTRASGSAATQPRSCAAVPYARAVPAPPCTHTRPHLSDDESGVALNPNAGAPQLQSGRQARNQAGILGLVVGVVVSHVLAQPRHLDSRISVSGSVMEGQSGGSGTPACARRARSSGARPVPSSRAAQPATPA